MLLSFFGLAEQRLLSGPQVCEFDFIIPTCSAAKLGDKCVGRSPLNVHCHLAVKLSERASFNKFNKNFKIRHLEHENILSKLEIVKSYTFTIQLFLIYWPNNSAINWSFIRWCKNLTVNHLQMFENLRSITA